MQRDIKKKQEGTIKMTQDHKHDEKDENETRLITAGQQQWIDWIVRLQSLAQAGLHYGRDRFDLERYQEIRDIAARMMAAQADLPLTRIRDLFCNEEATRRRKSTPALPSSRMARSCSSMKTQANGHCRAAGAMSTSR